MIHKRTSDTSFSGHFKANSIHGMHVLMQTQCPFTLIVLLAALPFAPFFWAYGALKKHRDGKPVMTELPKKM